MARSIRVTMYPKVKVREHDDDVDQDVYGRNSVQSLKSYNFSSANEIKDDSEFSSVRIPVSKTSTPATPKVVISKGELKNHSKKADENRPNIGAFTAPRPRAVLSSPDNDGMIGSKNTRRSKLVSGLKNHNSCENRHINCKVIGRSNIEESPIGTRKQHKESADHNKKGFQGNRRRDPVAADPEIA